MAVLLEVLANDKLNWQQQQLFKQAEHLRRLFHCLQCLSVK